MKHLRIMGAVLVVTGVGCGAAVPKELADARMAYETVSKGPTATLNPAGLHSAKETLAAAEHTYDVEGGTQETKDLAYAAQRRAQTAEVRGREIAWQQEEERSKVGLEQAKTAQLEHATEELGSTRAQLQQREIALVAEQNRRAEAERRMNEANALLQKFASVKQETRGMVITLSGNLLFTTNNSTLLPGAQVKLSDVADALTKQDPDSKIVVEGHADSQGEADHNLELSQQRAESVRSYLVERGIAADRIVAKGYGEERPIGDNTSAEGRANNRRVEIVVEQPSGG